MDLHPSTRKRLLQTVELLLEWHSANQRSLLWRGLRRTPYMVLVSEFMLQQTGAKQVEKMLPPFLRKFPTAMALAEASTADVLRAWQGLGYNRRALNLHKTAKALIERGRKPFPKTLEELMALPGVGRYTASAILSFSYNLDIPVVDVNIQRVLSRVWQPMKDYADVRSVSDVFDLDELILPRGNSGKWHEALMDFGSTICVKRAPKCEECPLLSVCKSGPGFLKLEHHELQGAKVAREREYYGQPRRIWRGRVLAIVAANNSITATKLLSQLSERHDVTLDKSFTEFINGLLDLLTTEGFVMKSRSSYSLPHG